MEVVYFLISVIEIILTVYLVSVMKKAIKTVNGNNRLIEEAIPLLNINYKKAVRILKVISLSFKAYKKYVIFEKTASNILKIKSVLSFLMTSEKNKTTKINILPLLRKILFFI